MRVQTQTATHLVLTSSPWVAWAAAIMVLCAGSVIAFAPLFEPLLSCTERTCDLRTNVIEGIEQLPRKDLLGGEAQIHSERPRLARLVLLVRDERRVFDLQFVPSARVDERVALVERFVAGRDKTLLLGSTMDPQRLWGTLMVCTFAALVIALRAQARELIFDAGQQTLTLREGGLFRMKTRSVPLGDVVLREHRDREWVLFLDLPGGERVDIDRVLVSSRADKHAMKEAVARFLTSYPRERNV